jgi:uncharacterized membrane protein YgcG
LLSLYFDPVSHYTSLAPDPSLAKALTGQALDQIMNERMTPQVKALQYYFMGALAFSAVVEPLLLYIAVNKLGDPRDSRTVVQAVLSSFAAFDIFHAAAAIAGSGIGALMPMTAEFDLYSGINFYVPMLWLVVRLTWFWRTAGKTKEL